MLGSLLVFKMYRVVLMLRVCWEMCEGTAAVKAAKRRII
jgi:hypothetical protein